MAERRIIMSSFKDKFNNQSGSTGGASSGSTGGESSGSTSGTSSGSTGGAATTNSTGSSSSSSTSGSTSGFASKFSNAPEKKPIAAAAPAGGGFASKTAKTSIDNFQDTTKRRDTGSSGQKFETIAKKSDGDRVFLVTGDNQNKKAWYYVLVEKTKLPIFKQKVTTDFIDLSLYGEIIECGWGEEPPEEIANRIKKDFY
jgi:hypothetical protein